ncbi:hypothetical protein BU16DRAFT_126533 [Lophium mytilinum]|uniref:Uncharacterized protein n=1 Tax=Lophium mytilinum TaxID=390894 RepID=A0A6A6QHM2_9PEZI|nr:hypothetical protein BU16DRAFT_126533 [Lophium mytilinum]
MSCGCFGSCRVERVVLRTYRKGVCDLRSEVSRLTSRVKLRSPGLVDGDRCKYFGRVNCAVACKCPGVCDVCHLVKALKRRKMRYIHQPVRSKSISTKNMS